MSSLSSLSRFTSLLLVACLVVGGGVGYIAGSSTLRAKVKDYESQVDDLNSQLADLVVIVSNLESDNEDYEEQVSGLENQVSDLETQTSSLNIKISEMETEISGYEAQVSELETELGVVKSETETSILEYEEQVAILESQISFYRTRLRNLYLSSPFQIGITAVKTSDVPRVTAVVEIVEEEINEYSEKEGLPFTFDFVIRNNYDESVKAVDNTVSFNKSGINLIVGHSTSSHTSLSMFHVNTRNMLLLSPSANSWDLAIKGDNLFRTCPTDMVQGKAVAAAIDSLEIEAVIVLQRDDEWGNEFFDVFKTEYEKRGGVIFERILYDVDAEIYSAQLGSADDAVKEAIKEYGEDKVAVELIGQERADTIINMAEFYPNVYGIYWFGSSGTTQKKGLLKSAAKESDQLKIFGAVEIEENNTDYLNRASKEYRDFAAKYTSKTGSIPDFYTAAMYDACWLYALSIFETWSRDTSLIKQVLPIIAKNYQGASGLCTMDEYGDRVNVDYEIWGYSLIDDRLAEVKYGYYDASNGQVNWYSGTDFSPPS